MFPSPNIEVVLVDLPVKRRSSMNDGWLGPSMSQVRTGTEGCWSFTVELRRTWDGQGRVATGWTLPLTRPREKQMPEVPQKKKGAKVCSKYLFVWLRR